MKTRTCRCLLLAALALASLAGAQTSAAPVAAPGGSGGQRSILVPYAPYVTQTGAGWNGADISEIEPGFTTYGFLMDEGPAEWRVADDLTVPAGESWSIDSVGLLAFQVGGPLHGAFTEVKVDVWDHDPLTGGSPLLSVPFNLLSSQVWTGAFRVDTGFPTDNSRSIVELRADVSGGPALPSGTYWFSCTARGSASFGLPEASVQVPWDPANNGRQYFEFSGWSAAVDTLSGKTHGFLFQVEGTVQGGGGVSTFCNSRPSSIPGCIPSLWGPSSTLSKSAGSGSYEVAAEPVPGGSGKVGILIYTVDGLLSTPLGTPYGDLCLNQFKRATIPAVPGGEEGECDGRYSWDFGAFAVGATAITVGSTLHIQAWYRDTPNPGGADFTEGIGPISVLP